MRTRYLPLFSFVVALMVAQSAHAALTEIKPLNFKGLYHIGWGGITLGYIVFGAKEENGLYEASVEIQTAGLAKVFKKHKSASSVKGALRQGMFLPVKFHTEYQRKRKDKREIDINYDRSGQIIYEYMTPPENRAERPAVTPKEKQGSVDPITSVFELRSQLQQALVSQKKTFNIPVYEGRRLMQMDVNIGDEETIKTDHNTYKAIKMLLSRTPKAGYTAKETKEYEEGDPKVYAYFCTDDARVFPVKVEVELMLGKLLTQLVKECDYSDSCSPN